MPKQKATFCSDVCYEEGFLSLSSDAQAFYFLVSFETDLLGEVRAIERRTAFYGVPSSVLGELKNAGYLLEIGGRTFVTHHRQHNDKLSGDKLVRLEEYFEAAPESLDFAGEPFNSAFVVREVSTEVGTSSDLSPLEREQEPERKKNKKPKGNRTRAELEEEKERCTKTDYPYGAVYCKCGAANEPGAKVCMNPQCARPLS